MAEFGPALTPTPHLQIAQNDRSDHLHPEPAPPTYQVQVQVQEHDSSHTTSFNSTLHSPRVTYDDVGVVPSPSGLFMKLKRRNARRAKFPAPVDQLFTQAEVGKAWFTITAAMVSVLASYHQYGIISEECMESLFLLLSLSLIFNTAATLLQNLIPEVAVAAMLAGVCTTVASVNAAIFSALPPNKRFLQNFLVFPGYISLLLVILRQTIYARQDSTTSESSSYLAS